MLKNRVHVVPLERTSAHSLLYGLCDCDPDLFVDGRVVAHRDNCDGPWLVLRDVSEWSALDRTLRVV